VCRGEYFLFYLSYLCVFSVVFLRIEKWPKNPSTFFFACKTLPSDVASFTCTSFRSAPPFPFASHHVRPRHAHHPHRRKGWQVRQGHQGTPGTILGATF
jgi:hypothetical protein